MTDLFVSALFSDEEHAARAIRELTKASYPARDISVLYWSKHGVEEAPVEKSTLTGEGAAIGGALGAALGSVGAILVATGIMAGPGLAVIASGPILAAIQGAAGGAMAGGVTGALAGLGFWKAQAQFPELALREGAYWIGVSVSESRAREAQTHLRDAGGQIITP